MSARPDEAIASLANFTPCLDPGVAIVDRRALEEVLRYLAKPRLTIEAISSPQPRPINVIAGRCLQCGSPR